MGVRPRGRFERMTLAVGSQVLPTSRRIDMRPNELSRRDVIRMGIAGGVGVAAGGLTLSPQTIDLLAQARELPLITKPIPSSNERLPIVGLGTAQTWGDTPHD